MRVSCNWLRELCDPGLGPDELAGRLTMAGLEVEGVERLGEDFSGVVVAEVVSSRPHPRSQKLTLVTIRDDAGTFEVVCGAPNVPAAGRRVLWARPGARLPGGFAIAVKDIAGVSSPGMLCSEKELGLGEDAGGIIVLGDEDAAAAPGQTAQDALALRDTVLEVNVTPNRGDCLGHLGVAREVAALTGAPLTPPAAGLEGLLGDADAAAQVEVSIEDPVGCPRYTARVIEGLSVRPSPRWLRRRLEAVGVRPLANLIDITNYVLFELGQPLHAFDLERVGGRRIIVRRARPGERMVTLDEQERVLEPGDLLICDARGPVALAGVMGGAGSEVGAGTRGVLLESACFDPPMIRRTARRLGLHSESSHRFERGVDPNGADFASARAARLMCELGGGRVARGLVDVYPRPAAQAVVDLRPARAELVLGVRVAEDEMRARLTSLGLRVEGGGERLRVTVPTFRPDLEREIDLIEEVARLAGLDRIPATLPPAREAPAGPAAADRLAEDVRDALAAAGLDEAVTYGFTSPARLAALGLSGEPVALRNPLREEQSVLRTSLLVNLLAAAARNAAVGELDVRLFEIGHVFLPGGAELPHEPRRVAAVLAGQRSGWLQPGGALDFADARGVLEQLFERLHVPVELAPTRAVPWLHPGVAAEVRVPGGAPLGAVGEVHPEARERLGLERRVYAFEIDLDALPPLAPPQMQPLPRFPSVTRDVSFFVDARVPAAEVRRVVLAHRPALLEEVRVLEDYREAGRVPAGKKGMLWSMTYRAPDRTLTDAEVDSEHERLVARLLSDIGAERR